MHTLSVCILMLLCAPMAWGQSNVLMMLADDVGVDTVNVYAEHPIPAKTPNIDLLAARGVLFRNAYSNPSCSPTRATILSGNYAWRTGIGNVFGGNPAIPAMQLSGFTTLPDALSAATYSSAMVGKWHLGDCLQHPISAGFDEVHGSINSIANYYQFYKNVNGSLQLVTTYATTDTVNDALALMQTLHEPWFIWVSFNAAHTPYHMPPPALHTYQLPPGIRGNEPIYSRAIIEAMDTEIGRLLNSIDETDTTVIFVGDNGPEGVAVLPPWTAAHAKTSVYEQGVRVPLIVVGPDVVQGAECAALVNTTDLFATIADLAGAPHEAALDSVSMVPYFADPGLESLRTYVFVETFLPNFLPLKGSPATFLRSSKAVRGDRYKLAHFHQQPSKIPTRRELYDLLADPLETVNLLDGQLTPEQADIYTALQVQLVNHGPSPWTNLGGGVGGIVGVPELVGTGSLVSGTTTTITLSQAASHAAGAVVLGWAVGNAPFLCGVMIPTVDNLIWVTTDSVGRVTGTVPWPALPPLTQVTFQAWIGDAAAPCGYSASNGLTATSAP
jgi:arylsulfatase B